MYSHCVAHLQGRMDTALDYLEFVPGEASTTVAVLKDRIYRSGAGNLPNNMHAPPFPFIREEVHSTVDASAKVTMQCISVSSGSYFLVALEGTALKVTVSVVKKLESTTHGCHGMLSSDSIVMLFSGCLL